jgi:hypothetical protein
MINGSPHPHYDPQASISCSSKRSASVRAPLAEAGDHQYHPLIYGSYIDFGIIFN